MRGASVVIASMHFQHKIWLTGENETNMRQPMEYLICQQTPFVVYGDWNIVPQRRVGWLKCYHRFWLRGAWQRRALVQMRWCTSELRHSGRVPWRPPGLTLIMHRAPTDVKIRTPQETCEWTLRYQCHDGISDLVSGDINDVLRDAGVSDVLGDASPNWTCAMTSSKQTGGLGKERCGRSGQRGSCTSRRELRRGSGS